MEGGENEEEALQDDAQRALSRQIRKHVDEETMRIQTEAIEAGEEIAEEAQRMPLHLRLKQLNKAQLRYLAKKLEDRVNLEEGVREGLPFGEEQHLPKEEEDEEMQRMIDMDRALAGQRKVRTVKLQPRWARLMSLWADTISSWRKFEPEETVEYTVRLKNVEIAVRDSVCAAALVAEEKRFLQQAQDWNVGILCTLAERQLYRFISGGMSSMKPEQVVHNIRDQDFEKGWPERVGPALDPEHPMYELVSGYAVFWWLEQNLPSVDVNSTVFLWDAQEELLAFDRLEILSPVICRVSARWVVVEEWGDDEDFKGEWFGRDLISAVAYWTHRVWSDKYGGIIYNHCTREEHDLNLTPISEMLEDVPS